jgi:uncharacterized protein YjiS (DUF1127 family)
MAYVITPVAAPFGAETTLRIVDFVTDLADTMIAGYKEYQTTKVLAQLSPEQLYDIGLSRR